MTEHNVDLGSRATYQISRFLELGDAYPIVKGTYVVSLTGLPSLLELLMGAGDVAFPGVEKPPAVEIRLKGQPEPSSLHHGEERTLV
jgi:hypothetical protein